MGAIPLDPTCDVCGTTKRYRQGIGSFCPNINCGGVMTAEELHSDKAPADGKYAQLSKASVKVVMQEKLRTQPTLDKVDVIDLYGVLEDGTERRLSALKVQVRYPDPDRRAGAKRTVFSKMNPDGVTLRVVTRDGVDLR